MVLVWLTNVDQFMFMHVSKPALYYLLLSGADFISHKLLPRFFASFYMPRLLRTMHLRCGTWDDAAMPLFVAGVAGNNSVKLDVQLMGPIL